MNIKTEITKIHYDKNSKNIFVPLLSFASIFYGLAIGLKNILYDKKIIKPKRVNAYVISVGNLTTGGVGKTPIVSEIAKYLQNKGEKVAIVSRGYGGRLSNREVNIISDGDNIFFDAKDSGDEPNWLAKNTKGVVVATCRSRYKAAEFVIKKFDVTHIILDDGFQHRKLHRDLDILVADSKLWFGCEQLLPRGPLREGLEAFSRVDRFIVVSKDTQHSRAEKLVKIMNKKTGLKSFVCKIEPDYIYNIKTGERLEKSDEAVAISAIGQPEQFYAFLKDYNVKETISFDDHHIYRKEDIPQCKIVTTEKDAVKLLDFDRDDIYALRLRTELSVSDLI